MGREISITVNGTTHTSDVEPRLLLVEYLRDVLNLTGTHVGCDTSNCGACTVSLNGSAVKSCTVFAVQADGGEVTTVEGWRPTTAICTRYRKGSGRCTVFSAVSAHRA